jgi:hypothetical protein
MKRITTLLLAVTFFFTAKAQDVVDDWTPVSAVTPLTEAAPTLDAARDEAVFSGDSIVLERWNYYTAESADPPHELVGPEPMEFVEGWFWIAYDDDALYLYSELIGLDQKEDNFEIGLSVDLGTNHHDYSYESNPITDDGFLFAKAVLGPVGGSAVPENEVTEKRGVDWYWTNTADGYLVEARLPWDKISNNTAAYMDSVMERGVMRFDVWYKLGTDREVFGWSTNDNKSYRRTHRMGVIELLEAHQREETTIPRTTTVPALDGVIESEVYSGELYSVETWTTRVGNLRRIPTPIEDVTSEFQLAYDDDNLYVVGTLNVPESVTSVELGVMVSMDPDDADYGWQGTIPTADGFLFSKAVFGTDIQPDAIGTSRLMQYYYYDGGNGEYEWEIRASWADLTEDPAVVTAFKERGTFFFDLGFKLNAHDSTYVQWSSNDNRFWRETFRTGIISTDFGTNLSEVSSQEPINLYPNPARNVLNITAPINSGEVEIFNLLGSRVLVTNLESGSIDISALKQGIYTLRIANKNGQSIVQKFVKN